MGNLLCSWQLNISGCCLVGPFVRGEEAADVRWTVRHDDDDVVELTVSQLAPATNYTLLVYAVTGGQREIHSFIATAPTVHNFVPYLCQLVFAAILLVKLS